MENLIGGEGATAVATVDEVAAALDEGQPQQGSTSYIGNDTMVTINNKTQTLRQWSEETGINMSTLSFRILHKWADDRILSKPAPTGRWTTAARAAAKRKKKAQSFSKKKAQQKHKQKQKPAAKVRTKETPEAFGGIDVFGGITEYGDLALVDLTIYEVLASKENLMVLVRKDRLRKKH